MGRDWVTQAGSSPWKSAWVQRTSKTQADPNTFFPEFNLWTFEGRLKVLRSHLPLSWQQPERSRGETHRETPTESTV